jgi:hypothetical protein
MYHRRQKAYRKGDKNAGRVLLQAGVQGAQRLAQDFEQRHLIGDTIDPIVAGGIFLHDGVARRNGASC